MTSKSSLYNHTTIIYLLIKYIISNRMIVVLIDRSFFPSVVFCRTRMIGPTRRPKSPTCNAPAAPPGILPGIYSSREGSDLSERVGRPPGVGWAARMVLRLL